VTVIVSVTTLPQTYKRPEICFDLLVRQNSQLRLHAFFQSTVIIPVVHYDLPILDRAASESHIGSDFSESSSTMSDKRGNDQVNNPAGQGGGGSLSAPEQ
jgi:hypothetical protein